jgi:hypothetical protein
MSSSARVGGHLLGFFALSLLCAAPSGAKGKPPEAPCVASVASLPVHDLARVAFDDRGEFKLAARNGCMRIAEGEYPAGLFALPQFAEPYAVRVAAWVEGGVGSRRGVHVVSPRLTLLDAQFAATRTFGAEDLVRRGQQFSIDVFLNPENGAERYLLVHVEPERLGEVETRTNVGSTLTPVVIGTGVMMITSGHDEAQEVEVRATGRLVLGLLGDWAKRFGEERKRARKRR